MKTKQTLYGLALLLAIATYPNISMAHQDGTNNHNDCDGNSSRDISTFGTFSSNHKNYEHNTNKHDCDYDDLLNIIAIVGGLALGGLIIWSFSYGGSGFTIEDIKDSPIKPMFYVDDKEQTLGLRYTIRF